MKMKMKREMVISKWSFAHTKKTEKGKMRDHLVIDLSECSYTWLYNHMKEDTNTTASLCTPFSSSTLEF